MKITCLTLIRMLVVATLWFAVGCSTVSGTDKAADEQPIIVIQKRSAGVLLQEFNVRVFPNKLVVYEGVKNVRLKGEHRYYLSDAQYKRLLQAFDSFGFMDWQPPRYSVAAALAATISLHTERGTKTILFPQIREYFLFMKSIDEQLGTAKLRCPGVVFLNGRNVDTCELEAKIEASFL